MPAADEELTELLVATGAGDRDAFKTLYDRTTAKLFGVILRVVRDRGLASDVLQDVFLRIWQSAKTYRGDAGRPMAWLVAVARYGAIDALRKREDLVVAGGHEVGHALEATAAEEPEPDLLAQRRLATCLQRLDAQQRQCVVLAYCDGYSRAELARVTGRPVGTVKTWLHRSLHELRRCLESP